jgi:hypothetical protein
MWLELLLVSISPSFPIVPANNSEADDMLVPWTGEREVYKRGNIERRDRDRQRVTERERQEREKKMSIRALKQARSQSRAEDRIE